MEPESGRLTSPGGAAKRAIRPSTLPTRPAIRDESDATNSDTSLAALRKTLEPVGRMFNPDDVSLKFSPLASPDLKKLAIPSPDIDKLIAAASAPTLQTPSAVSLFLQSLTGVSAAGGAAHSPTTPILAFSPFGVIGGLPVGVALTPTGSGSSSASESAPLPGPSTVPSGLPDMAQTLAVTASVSSSLAPLMVPIGLDLGSMALLQQLGVARGLQCLSPMPLVTSAGAQLFHQQQLSVQALSQVDAPKMEHEPMIAASEQAVGKRSRLCVQGQAHAQYPTPPPAQVQLDAQTAAGVYQQQRQQMASAAVATQVLADSTASWARNASSSPLYMQAGAAPMAHNAASSASLATVDGYSIASHTSSANEHLEDGRSSRSTYVSSVSFSTTQPPLGQRPAQSHSPLGGYSSSVTVEGQRPLASVQPFSITAPSAPSSADSSMSSAAPTASARGTRGQKRASSSAGGAKKSGSGSGAGSAKQEDAHVVPSDREGGGSSKAGTRPIDMGHQETFKQERKRERNRIAARKCRERKMSRIAELSSTVETLECDKEQLSTQISTLNDEIVRLRQIINEHEHSGCNVPITAATLSALRGATPELASASARASVDQFSSTSNSPLVVHDAQFQQHVSVSASPAPGPQQSAVRLSNLASSYVHNAPPHNTSYS